MQFTDVLGQMGQGNFDWSMINDLLTSWVSALVGLAGALVYACVRFKLIRLVSVDEATEWVRAKWGKVQYYRTDRFGHEQGRLVRLKAGRHLVVRGIYDGWEVSLKEILLKAENVEMAFQGRMLLFGSLTFGYEVIATNDKRGDKMMLRSLLSVRNIDRDNQKSEELDQKVIGVVVNELRLYLATAQSDDFYLPIIVDAVLRKRINRVLRANGVKLKSWMYASPVWKDGQMQLDAGTKIADAIRELPFGLPDNVRELPSAHTA